MKKLILLAVVCLIAFTAFSQKKNVSTVKTEISGAKPDFKQAQTLIKEALDNPETKDDPETWYVAGNLEDKIFSNENSKQLLKQEVNEPLMYEALVKSYDYFRKVFELEKIPNEKGKINNKFSKQAKSILKVNQFQYIDAGVYYHQQQAYDKAYEAFNIFLEIPELDIFNGEKLAADSIYNQIALYASYCASYTGDEKTAIRLLESLKDKKYEQESVYSSLADSYRNVEDTVQYMNILKEGSLLFPKNIKFIQSLINHYINTGQMGEAMIHLDNAIAQEPGDPQYWRVKGELYEAEKNFDKALLALEESLKIDPEFPDAVGAIGRLYYNKGFELQTKANELSIQESKVEIEKVKELYRKALPHLEKARIIFPEEKQYIMALYSVYYRLDMPKEMNEMEKLLNDDE